MKAILREKFGISEGEPDKVLGFKVSSETYVSYHTLSKEDKAFVKEVVETVVNGLKLGYIERGASPQIVLKRKVAPATITIEEVERSELEERVKRLERSNQLLKDDVEYFKALAKRNENLYKACLEEKAKSKHDPELERRYNEALGLLNTAIHLISLVYQPSVEDFARDSRKKREFAEGAKAFLNRVIAYKESLKESEQKG